MTQKRRFYMYRIIVAVIPLLIALGYITESIGNHALAIALAVLGLGAAVPAQSNSNPKNVVVEPR